MRFLLTILLLPLLSALPAQCWKQVCASRDFTVAIRTDGSLWTWGDNSHEQLGNALNTRQNKPVQLDSNHHWVQIAAGWTHVLALRADGTLWGWGNNQYGQLNGTQSHNSAFGLIQIGTDSDWTLIAAAFYASTALKKDGSCWYWGEGISCGISNGQASGPQRVDTITGCIKIAVGSKHLAVLKKDGTLWTCGGNSKGQLGIGNELDSPRLVQVQASNTWPWIDVAAGIDFTIALKADGSLWGWGQNMVNRFTGQPRMDAFWPQQLDRNNNWVKLAAGLIHGLMVDSRGDMWAWGVNSNGQLGVGHEEFTISPLLVRTSFRDAWPALSAGRAHSVAIDSNGRLYAWGNNDSGALGDGTNTQSNVPVLIPCDLPAEGPSTAKLHLYPNPVQEELVVKLDDIPVENLQYEVQNTLGQLMVSRRIVPDDFRIDVRNLPRDFYLLYVYNEHGHAARLFAKW